MNPTVSQPASLFTPLPDLELGGPRPNLLGAVYPFGGQVTVSGSRWDARAAVIDTSPPRRRRILSDVNPPRFGNVIVGAGITPVIGLRFGASVAHFVLDEAHCVSEWGHDFRPECRRLQAAAALCRRAGSQDVRQ